MPIKHITITTTMKNATFFLENRSFLVGLLIVGLLIVSSFVREFVSDSDDSDILYLKKINNYTNQIYI